MAFKSYKLRGRPTGLYIFCAVAYGEELGLSAQQWCMLWMNPEQNVDGQNAGENCWAG